MAYEKTAHLHEFAAAFNKLRRRLDLPLDNEMAADYYTYLSVRLTPEQMQVALTEAWASAARMPSPAELRYFREPVALVREGGAQ